MSDPISFTSASPRFELPYLFVSQAQKEAFINEALSRIDALLHVEVEGTLNSPPASPADGQSWIVGSSPTGAWTGHAQQIASRQGGNWLFAMPVTGMQLFDKAAARRACFNAGWNYASPVSAPSGGTTIDTQARTAIAGLIAALMQAGILA